MFLVKLSQNFKGMKQNNSNKIGKLQMLRVSCLKLEINEFRCYEAKIEESEKGRQPPGVEPRTPLA